MHTSTVTVAVLHGSGADTGHPCARRSPDDYRIEWFRGSGAGGQHRNKHANSARVIHIPTGLKQECQGRKREANLQAARAALDVLLDARLREDAHGREASLRAFQIGSGMRGDKRRTYRFQEDLVTDHQTGKTASATCVMKGGMDELWHL